MGPDDLFTLVNGIQLFAFVIEAYCVFLNVGNKLLNINSTIFSFSNFKLRTAFYFCFLQVRKFYLHY